MSNNNYQCQLDVPASIDRALFAIPRIRPINWFVSALGMSRVRLWLIMITIAALCAVPMLGQGATSSPDAFEGSPYNDDASTTTLNILPSNISQDHTIHADDDVDWGISIQTEPETKGAFPYSLKFTNLVIPSGSFLVVELYEDGPSSPPSKAAYVSSGEQSRSVAWLGVGIEQIYYAVSAFGSVSPAMSYTVTFTEPTGANNGLASAIGAYAMRVEWETLGVDPSAQGFNVLQSTTGEETSFIPVNTGLLPIPVTPGPCPGSGCVEYEDTGLNPTTIYFYQIEIIESDSSPSTWLGTFYGYTEPPEPPLSSYEFDTTVEGWSFLGLSGANFSGASSSYTGGRLGVSSANDSTNRVGFWNGPTEIAYVADNVYRARYLVSSNAATASQNPQFRMRWTHDQSLESATQVVNAGGTFSNSLPTDPTTKEYTCYIAPVVSGNLGVAFDMLDFSAAQYGEHYVDEVTVERFPDPAAGTAVKTYTDTADFANWGFASVGFGPVTSGGSGTGTLQITSTVANANNYGWWQCSSTANELTYVADKLYRATYTLRCVSDAARNTMPQVRLRCQNEDGQMTATMELNSQGTGPGAMPTTGGTDYDVYFETPTQPGSPTAGEDGFIVTIDMLDFNSAQGGTIYMDSVAIDYLPIP